MSTLLPGRTTGTGSGRALLAGLVAGPPFVGSVVVQALTRPGFDAARHPLSSLALGPQGWLQVITFVVAGLLSVAGAVGLRVALRGSRAGTWGPILFAVNGIALIVAGIFPADPVHRYPAGAASVVSWHGAVHSAAPALAGLAGFVVFGRRFAVLSRPGWVASCMATPAAVLLLNAASFATGDFRLVLLAEAVGWAWTTAVFGHVRAACRADGHDPLSAADLPVAGHPATS
jgi:hypothetical protein